MTETAAPGPHTTVLELLNTKLDQIEQARDRAYAELNTYALATDAADILSNYPGAKFLTLISWEDDETDQWGGYSITHGAILDADGRELDEALNGSMSSTHLNGEQPWVAAYINKVPYGHWAGTLDLRKLVEIGAELAATSTIVDHIEQVSRAAHCPTMIDVLTSVRDRETVTDDTFLGLTPDGVAELYDRWFMPMVTNIELYLG